MEAVWVADQEWRSVSMSNADPFLIDKFISSGWSVALEKSFRDSSLSIARGRDTCILALLVAALVLLDCDVDDSVGSIFNLFINKLACLPTQ